MDREKFAKGLQKNPLLRELLEDFKKEIHQTWEAESESEKREQLWLQLKVTNDLGDFINATISDILGRESGDRSI